MIFSCDNELLSSTEAGNLTTSFLRRTFIVQQIWVIFESGDVFRIPNMSGAIFGLI